MIAHNGDAFVAKYSSNGDLIWARNFGDQGLGIAVDGLGSFYATGTFNGPTDFDSGPGLDLRTSNGGNDIFLAKLDNSGNVLFVHTFGYESNDQANDLAIDANNNVYMTGFVGTNLVDFRYNAWCCTGWQ